jgi:hypothetical protein
MRIRVLIVILACATTGMAGQTPDELRTMHDANQDFVLRHEVERGGSDIPSLYRGLIEASENKVGAARKDLQQVLKSDPHSKDAYAAYEALGNMAFRNGLNREALRWLEDAHAKFPDSDDMNNALPIFRALAAGGDMKLVRLRNSSVDSANGLPVVINGKKVTYGFDTGGAQSVMGEADAKMLGLQLMHVETRMRESSGTAIPGFDLAVAKDLVISGLHLRNVPFLVLKDTGEPFVHVPVGQRGLIGLPVLIAMRAIRWEPTGGRCEFGPGVRVKGTPLQNLLFDGATPIVQASVENKTLTFSLDTGAKDTDLNAGFAKTLPDLVAAGKKESRAITGYGGSNQYDSVLLGPTAFHVGGLNVTLEAPHVFPNHSLGKFDGNMGNDILNQAKSVTLDFEAMEMRLN